MLWSHKPPSLVICGEVRRKMTAPQGLRNIQKGLSTEHAAQTEVDIRRRWKALQQDPRLAPLPTR